MAGRAGMSSGWGNSCFRNPNNRCAPNSGKTGAARKTFSARGHITKSSHAGAAHNAAEASPQLVLAKPRRIGLRFARTASAMSWVSTKAIPRDVSGPARQPPPFFDRPHRSGFHAAQTQIPDARPEILNTFAYTCGFPCARRGWRPDDEPRPLEEISRMGPAQFYVEQPRPRRTIHLRRRVRLAATAGEKRARVDVVALDPPTFSHQRNTAFSARKRLRNAVTAALRWSGRAEFCSPRQMRGLAAGEIIADVEKAIHSSRRKILQRHYFPQPPDFPSAVANRPI